MNFLLLYQIFWYAPPSSLCFFQFVTTCNTSHKLRAHFRETYSQQYICPFSSLATHSQRETSTLRRTGRGSCTPKVVTFLKKARGCIVRSRKLNFTAKRCSIKKNFFMQQAAIIDEIVARDSSQSCDICRWEYLTNGCPIGGRLAIRNYILLDILNGFLQNN